MRDIIKFLESAIETNVKEELADYIAGLRPDTGRSEALAALQLKLEEEVFKAGVVDLGVAEYIDCCVAYAACLYDNRT